jgi:glycosyltransferase involved in cell wall biosynthesis
MMPDALPGPVSPDNAPIRVLHFFKCAMPDTLGGVERVIDQLGRGTPKRGLEVIVLSLSRNPEPPVVKMDGYAVHREAVDLEVASTPFSRGVLRRFGELADWADIIHYHFPWPFMDVAHFVARISKPTVVTYHSDIIRQRKLAQVYRPLMNRFLGSVSRIVATSPNYLSTSTILRRFRSKVSVIPIGLDCSTYPSPDENLMREWSAKLGPKFLLFVGVLRYYKGLHILLEAARGLDYPLVIVGSGPGEDELRAKASELGLRNVHFLGFLPDEDKVALLKLAYGVVFPSHLRSEAFGITLLEGAMFGKPLISSEIGTGTSFVNIDKETGLVVPPSDPAALRNAMRWLWENEAEAAQMGKRAQERYRQLFTADQMNDRYAALYRELLGRERSAGDIE